MLLTMTSSGTRRSTQVGACLMVIIIVDPNHVVVTLSMRFFQILALCFAVIIGGMSPKELWNSQQSGYTTSSGEKHVSECV